MYGSFASAMREQGSIIVSHRLASAKLADKIIVIDGGATAEIGSHGELMERNGLYARMFDEQRSWYVDSEVTE